MKAKKIMYTPDMKWAPTPVPRSSCSRAAGIVPAEQAAIEIGQLPVEQVTRPDQGDHALEVAVRQVGHVEADQGAADGESPAAGSNARARRSRSPRATAGRCLSEVGHEPGRQALSAARRGRGPSRIRRPATWSGSRRGSPAASVVSTEARSDTSATAGPAISRRRWAGFGLDLFRGASSPRSDGGIGGMRAYVGVDCHRYPRSSGSPRTHGYSSRRRSAASYVRRGGNSGRWRPYAPCLRAPRRARRLARARGRAPGPLASGLRAALGRSGIHVDLLNPPPRARAVSEAYESLARQESACSGIRTRDSERGPDAPGLRAGHVSSRPTVRRGRSIWRAFSEGRVRSGPRPEDRGPTSARCR